MKSFDSDIRSTSTFTAGPPVERRTVPVTCAPLVLADAVAISAAPTPPPARARAAMKAIRAARADGKRFFRMVDVDRHSPHGLVGAKRSKSALGVREKSVDTGT